MRVYGFFVMYSMRCMGSNNPSTQHNSPVIHQGFSESKIQIVVLPPKGHEANKANQTKSYGKKIQENGKLQVYEPSNNRSVMFPKSTNWIV